MKYLYLEQRGFIWRTPASVIAANRAENYKEDGYQEEYDYTMENDHEIDDWFFNNMDFDDVKWELVKSPEPTVGPVQFEDYESEIKDVE